MKLLPNTIYFIKLEIYSTLEGRALLLITLTSPLLSLIIISIIIFANDRNINSRATLDNHHNVSILKLKLFCNNNFIQVLLKTTKAYSEALTIGITTTETLPPRKQLICYTINPRGLYLRFAGEE